MNFFLYPFFPPICSIHAMHFIYVIYYVSDVSCRYFLVEKAKDANIVGILVGTLGVGKFPFGMKDQFV